MTHSSCFLVQVVTSLAHLILGHKDVCHAHGPTQLPVDNDHLGFNVYAGNFSNVVADKFGLLPSVFLEGGLDEGCVKDLSILPSGVCPPVVAENGIPDAGILESNASFVVVGPLAVPELRADNVGVFPSDVDEVTLVEVYSCGEFFGPPEGDVHKGNVLKFHFVEVEVRQLDIGESHVLDMGVVQVFVLDFLVSNFFSSLGELIIEVFLCSKGPHGCKIEKVFR